MMSNDGSHEGEIRNETVALLLDGDGGDALTDLLVSALQDAFRFLADEAPIGETHH